MRLSDLAFLLEPTIPSQGNGSATIALYGMISALGVAGIGLLASVLNKLLGGKTLGNSTAATVKRTAKEHEAWERWLLLNNLDPRKIKTGYETMEEVRHASAS